MPQAQRLRYQSYIDNREQIESRWGRFGDRTNELVIIGQDIDEDLISTELIKCLCTEREIIHMQSGGRFEDSFPVFG